MTAPDAHADADPPEPASDEEELLARLRLVSVQGVGPILMARLIERFGTASAVFEQPARTLGAVAGIGPKLARAVLDPKAQRRAERERAEAEAEGITLLTPDRADFPPLLRELPDPPPLLYVLGALAAADGIAVAVVGSRNCSYYGRDQARRFGRLLAGAGFTVVSGFARGIDTAAHEGAILGGGRTIAVIGSGLLDIYPPENRDFAADVIASGALVSEFPLHYPPGRENFPRRNRIVAGMSLGTLVIEARARSGALITARLAGEYGREVFAVPGAVSRPHSQGCHSLIKSGARLVEDLDDILAELGPVATGVAAGDAAWRKRAGELFTDSTPEPGANPTTARVPLSADEATTFAALSGEPQNLDALASRTGLGIPKLTAALMQLEMKRQARQLAGHHFVRATDS